MRPAIRILASLGAITSLLGVAIGSGLSDRYLWSQVVAWAPREVWFLLLGVSGLLWAMVPGRTRPTGGRRRDRTRAVGLLCGIVGLVGAMSPWIRVGPRPREGVSVAWWNMSGYEIEDLDVLRGMDVVIVAHPGLASTEASIRSLHEHARSLAGVHVASAFPIERLEWISLGFEARHRNSAWNDRGRALCLETGGRVFWVVDLPSEPMLHRESVTSRAAARIAETGFAPPDVLVGDFNITRGSRSLRHLAHGLRSAHEQAGFGLGLTYPRGRPLVAIDLVYTRDGVSRHEVVDPGEGSHRVVRVWLPSTGG